MTRSLAIALLFSSALTLGGCDQITELTGGGSSTSGGGDGTSSAGGATEGDDTDGGSDDGGPAEIGISIAKEKGGISTLINPGGYSKQPPPPVEGISRSQCTDLADGGPVDGPGCITAELTCGQTVIGHTRGGVTKFSTRFYEKHFCTPATTDHEGGDERVYLIHGPAERGRIWVTLDTPCADLDLAVIAVHNDDCPDIDADVPDCEMWPKPRNKREVVDVPNVGNGTFIAVVEGKDDEEGAFALTVQCGEWM